LRELTGDRRSALLFSKETDADAVEISHAVRDRIPSLEQKLGNNTKSPPSSIRRR
jgi:hypothetical protein